MRGKIFSPGGAAKHVGEKMTFYCDNKGPVNWYFVRSDHDQYSLFISNKEHLEIYPVKIMDGGYYYCYGQYPVKKNQKPHYFLSWSKLEVYG